MLKSNDSLVSTGRCLMNPGEEYVVYQNEASPFRFDIPELPQSYTAYWFHPLSGEYIDAGKLKTGANQLKPPAKWGNVPVVLHIVKK